MIFDIDGKQQVEIGQDWMGLSSFSATPDLEGCPVFS